MKVASYLTLRKTYRKTKKASLSKQSVENVDFYKPVLKKKQA